MASVDDYFIPAGHGSKHNIFPGVDITTTTGQQMLFSVVHLAPHSVVKLHAHPHEQMGILISGRMKFTIGDVTKTVLPGDIWRIPGGVPHTVTCGPEPSVALDVFHPIREDYR